MIARGLPVYVALEPVDMRFGYERLGGIVRERMQAEPRSRALFVFESADVGRHGRDRRSQKARRGEVRIAARDTGW